MNIRSSLAFVASAALILAACETSSSSVLGDGGTKNEGGNSGGGGDASGGAGGAFNPTGSGGNGSGGQEECAGTETEAETKKLHMLVVFDRSGSMSGAKWDGSRAALTDYINGALPGTAVGINFFPPLGSGDQCEAASYNPPQVPLGDLPGHAMTLIDTMNSTSVTGVTPTYAAMFGSLQVATAVKDANPDDAVIVVLASDGQPSTCDTNIQHIASLSASAYAYNGVRTYAVAIAGSDLASLSTIAQAGLGEAFDVTGDINLFKEKLDEITAQALGCEYAIPPLENMEFDPLKLNLFYTPGDNSGTQTLPQADDLADCNNLPGWYYDDPDNPTKVILCPASCAVVQGDAAASVKLEFGCATKLN